MTNYWIVGATWNGDDQKNKFFKLGFWQMGWDDGDKKTLATKRNKIKEGDRIAIKTMNGRGQKTITIHAIGIVKGNDAGKIYIDWILMDMNRKVDSKGCYGTIHGSYKSSDSWVN